MGRKKSQTPEPTPDPIEIEPTLETMDGEPGPGEQLDAGDPPAEPARTAPADEEPRFTLVPPEGCCSAAGYWNGEPYLVEVPPKGTFETVDMPVGLVMRLVRAHGFRLVKE